MTRVLITGTNRGIGLELAKHALEMGWTVYGSARTPVSDGEAHICGHQNFHDLVFDVRDDDAIRAATAKVDGPIDILINNAGIIGPKRQSSLNMDFDGFAKTLDINTLGPLRVSQAFLPHLLKAENPRIITISSNMGSMQGTSFDRIAYRASKAAVNKVMQGLASDLKAKGVCVVSMHPGWVQTDMGGASADITVEESARGILAVAGSCTLVKSGQFLNYDGATMLW